MLEEPATSSSRELRLDHAYQGRAMFIKVSCKAVEPPVELAHHPELRFRFPPIEGGAPLIANSVAFEVRTSLVAPLPIAFLLRITRIAPRRPYRARGHWY